MAALDFGPAGSAPSVAAPDTGIAWWGWAVALLPPLLAVLLAWGLPRAARRPAAWPRLSALPPAAKLAVAFYLLATALTHAFAAGAIWQATRVAMTSNAEYFRYMKPLQLFRMSHQHAFGHGTMYLLLGALALCTRAGERLKVLGIALAGLGALADLASWWLQKFAGPTWEALSVAGGACFAAGFALMALLILRDLVRTD